MTSDPYKKNEWVKGLHTNFPVEERSPGVCMHVYYTRIICLLVEDVDIVVYLSLLLIYNNNTAIVYYEHS